MSKVGKYLGILIHGESKVGKTTLLATAPKPLLILDAEAGGMRFVKGSIIEWDPAKQAMPVADGSWDICRVVVHHITDMETVYRAIAEQPHPFKSMGLDSITEYQARIKRDIDSKGNMDFPGWGRLFAKLEELVWAFQAMCEHPKHPLDLVAVVAGTRVKDGKYRPYVQGQTTAMLPYKVDINGSLELFTGEDGVERRMLRIRGSEQHDVGERVHDRDGLTPAGNRLADIIWDPDLTEIFDSIYNQKEKT